jgi:transposase
MTTFKLLINLKILKLRFHYELMVMEFLKTSKIILIFLPTYSPNLNLIERLWKFFHEKVTNNRYYKKFEDFEFATMGFFENLSCYKKEFSVRLKDNFQIIDSTKNLVFYK